MEMVAWLAGEEHSDDPACACSVLASYVRALNDCLPSDAHRDRYLRPLLPRLVNTRGGATLSRRRAFCIADHGARVLAPMLLDTKGDHDAAARLRGLEPITCRSDARVAHEAAREAGAPRSVLWPLMMAARNHVPCNWVPAVVNMVRDIGTEAGYEAAAGLLGGSTLTPSANRGKPAAARV